MNKSFERHHLAMLLKYSGISFISGAVNHGFFSGERSLWTAACGILLFVAGAWLEHRLADGGPDASLASTLVWGTLLSIGLGFFTGGLQHFPDSPSRSAWVVPLGFVISVLALVAGESYRWKRPVVAYSTAGAVLVAAFSVGAWQWLDKESQHQLVEASNANDTPATTLQAQVVTRSIEVVMDDTMRFTPATIQARPGETLRIVARNAGRVPHELVLGSQATIREHAQAMRKDDKHAHAGAAISVAPGSSGELVVSFREATTLEMACLEPGHYEAGMRGTLQVAQTVPATKDGHTTHKH